MAAPGLSCSVQDLQSSMSIWDLKLWNVGSSFLTRDQIPGPLDWQHGIFATGSPERSQEGSVCESSFYKAVIARVKGCGFGGETRGSDDTRTRLEVI